MEKGKREKLLAIVALISFAIKLSANITFFSDSSKTFAAYDTELTPVGSPLLLCRVCFALPYSLVLVLYCVASTFRKTSGCTIIESRFYLSFSVSCIFEAIHIGLWAYSWIVSAFIFICAASFCQYVALYQAFTGLYAAKLNTDDLGGSKLWSQRIFVQSSLIFDCSWNSVLTILVLVVVLCYGIGLSSFQASVIGLIIFSIGLLIWFLIENLVVEKYVRYAGVEYVAISIAMTSLLTSDRTNTSILPIALLSLMSMVLILLFLRVFAIICLESRRTSRSQLYTMVQIWSNRKSRTFSVE